MSTSSKAITAKSTDTPAKIKISEALLYWLKLGFISFGGPAGQISMMHQELVERRRWISEHRFLHALNYTMVLPGPEAQQLATYIGWLMHGVKGGLIAGILFVLPSLFILIALTWIYLEYGNTQIVSGVLYGVKPAVTAIVLFAAYRIGSRALKNNVLRAMALLAFIAIFFFKIPFPLIVIGAGVLGFIGSRVAPKYFSGKLHASEEHESYGPAIIDDDTPIASHAKFSWSRLISFVAVGVGLWLGAIAFLYFNYGWNDTLTQMGVFFSKAALVTFGGAYAVLPYVYQGGVDQFQWLTGTQMIDGLALGETTPGPLIMVVTFVGFVGGWTKELFGPEALPLAGIVAACVVTFFTFLPSFLFIFIGGPAIEATREDLHFTAPLLGITAAVVGVIVNLAVFFAYHVLWPTGLEGKFDWISLVIGIVAFIALFKFKIDIVKVILGCAVFGWIFSLVVG
ncbi:MAG: chromate efflux transporter [Gammaproteobacteria bacterium]